MKKLLLTLSIAITSSSSLFAQWTNSGSSIYPSTLTNNVGIGTSSPFAKLDVLTNSNAHVLLGSTSSAFPSLTFGDSGGNPQYGTIKAYDLLITNGISSLMKIASNGYVGIGTVSPFAQLDVFTNSNAHVLMGSTSPANPSLTFADVAGQPQHGTINAYDLLIANGSSPLMKIMTNGNVGIGTASPDALLTVNGTIHSKEVKVTATVPAPDYVFEPDYQLIGLSELKDYLDKNHHLPEIPSAAQIEMDGINLGDMNMKLLKKVEELTLYLIEQQKINQSLQLQIDQLAKKN